MDFQPSLLTFDITVLQALHNTTWVKNELAADKQVRELLHIKPEVIAELYGYAYQLFQQQKYLEALHAFLFLTFIDTQQYDLWLGLGMALQMCQHYETAIDAYELAAVCDIENPVAYFYLAKCLFAIHDHPSALEALEMAIGFAEGQDCYRDLLHQALAAKQSLVRRC
jgi:type III secretion system low calcium response chaperone LcrH/SycD